VKEGQHSPRNAVISFTAKTTEALQFPRRPLGEPQMAKNAGKNPRAKSRNKAKPLLAGSNFVRNSRGGRKRSGAGSEGENSFPFGVGLALLRLQGQLAGVSLAHSLALAACRSPVEVYHAQARVASQIIDAYRSLLSAIAAAEDRRGGHSPS
jgi:hypothetical protein